MRELKKNGAKFRKEIVYGVCVHHREGTLRISWRNGKIQTYR